MGWALRHIKYALLEDIMGYFNQDDLEEYITDDEWNEAFKKVISLEKKLKSKIEHMNKFKILKNIQEEDF
jgi:hypothetical protein